MESLGDEISTPGGKKLILLFIYLIKYDKGLEPVINFSNFVFNQESKYHRLNPNPLFCDIK
jgi:hypothetical protein